MGADPTILLQNTTNKGNNSSLKDGWGFSMSNKDSKALYSNESLPSEYSEFFGLLQPYLDTAKRFYPVIAIVLVVYALLGGIMLPRIFKNWKIHKDQWAKCIEFPIISHLYHVVRKYYTLLLIGSLGFLAVLGLILYMKFTFHSLLLMIPASILLLMATIFAYIVQLFTQVYQVTMAIEIFKGFNYQPEEMINDELVAKQMNKKERIRSLYKIFLARDFLLMPVFLIVDGIRFYNGGTKEMVYISEIALIIFALPVFLATPIATVTRILKTGGILKNLKSGNLIQRIIFFQGWTISCYVVMDLIVISFLSFTDYISIGTLLFHIRGATALFLIFFIHAVLAYGRLKPEEKPIQPIDLEKAVESEKPPIVETY